ncbi:MAG: PQQ-binding-like beta-propeller repeat protein [Planctomycetota bacterium]|nr:PQQ-binding-like beta-propeller repeat protein [Planctomycetota bacterium]
MRPIVALSLLAPLALVAPEAFAQRARAVNPDDSVTAADALVRVLELDAGGNTPEGLRVLQQVLENEGERLLPVEGDADLYVPVRRVVHTLLVRRPELLARYRAQEGPRAAELLQSGDLARVERTHLLTPSGFEAMLRLAQLELESGRFESARLMLEQGEDHPDRTGANAADAARLALAIAARVEREGVAAWAARWAREGGVGAPAPGGDEAGVPELARPARTILDAGPPIDAAQLPTIPLRSVRLAPVTDEPEVAGLAAWAPVVSGRSVFVNDGRGVRGLDAVTLTPLWSTPLGSPGRSRSRAGFDRMNSMTFGGAQGADLGFPGVGGGVVVAHNAGPDQPVQRPDRQVVGLDVRDGRSLWEVAVGDIDGRLEQSSVRGGVVVDADTAILAFRESGPTVRLNRTHLVGLDLYTGRPKWVRLLGSVGTNPWGRLSSRPDLTVVHEGIVYRGDEMGVIGAFEAATGRPRWVRTLAPPRAQDAMGFRPTAPVPAHESNAPALSGGSLFYVEPGRGSVVELDAATGALRAQRDAAPLGEPRYVLIAGDQLACVTPTRVVFVAREALAEGSIRLSQEFRGQVPVGRVVTFGPLVYVPLADGVAVIDPARPSEARRLAMPATGSMLAVAGEDGGGAHVLALDATSIHTYVAWEHARALLERRVAQSPADPAPLLTYIELVDRAGRGGEVAPLADRVLALLEARGADEASTPARTQLTELLLAMIRRARAAWSQPSRPADPLGTPPITDAAVLGEILARLARAADAPRDAARVLLETAWLADVQNRPDAGVDAYQRILLDPALAAAALEEAEYAGDAAGDVAAARLAALLRRSGPGAYAAFDEEARLAADALPQDAGADQLAGIASRYPGSSMAPDLWRRAAEAHARDGRDERARRAVGAGLAAAELARDLGRPGLEPVVGALANALVAGPETPALRGGLYREMRRVALNFPGVRVTTPAGEVSAGAAAEALRTALASRDWPALLGTQVRAERFIEGLDPRTPLFTQAPGLATDCVLLVGEGRVELWGVNACTGELSAVWRRESEAEPSPILLTPDAALLHWPGAGGGWLERIGVDGRTAWKSRELGGVLRGPAGLPEAPAMPTPLDGDAGPADLVVSTDGRTVTIVRRSGAAATIDVATGEALWGSVLPMSPVFEVAHAGDTVIIAGLRASDDGRTQETAVISVDARTGEPRASLPASRLGDHPRWIRPLDGGDALLATSDALLRFSPATGEVKWTAAGNLGQTSVAGWQAGSALLVLDADMRLRRGEAGSGVFDPNPLPMGEDSHSRLSLPVSAGVVNGRLVLAGAEGVRIVDQQGALVGADSLRESRLMPAALGRDVLVTLDVPGDAFSPGSSDLARVLLLSSTTGKVLGVERVRVFDVPSALLTIDGKILIGQGAGTIVLDAPAR